MYQTVFGVGLCVIGWLVIAYNEPIARANRATIMRLYGLAIPLKLSRTIYVVSGVLFIVGGVLQIFHLWPAPWTVKI
jgi:hypothetical protein